MEVEPVGRGPVGAVAAGVVTRDEVTSLGAVLAADAPGRSDPEAVTLFDSTGLAIQDCDGRDVDRRARHLYSRSIGELRGAA